ncbi:hypothetical protein CC2G_005626 [Coprinopsis cinerea AmutBmut pab1-1]|nr:hypothetical protein CC2G_005626 [Coprinopsis cinerea AmutBmut pab1-1]
MSATPHHVVRSFVVSSLYCLSYNTSIILSLVSIMKKTLRLIPQEDPSFGGLDPAILDVNQRKPCPANHPTKVVTFHNCYVHINRPSQQIPRAASIPGTSVLEHTVNVFGSFA